MFLALWACICLIFRKQYTSDSIDKLLEVTKVFSNLIDIRIKSISEINWIFIYQQQLEQNSNKMLFINKFNKSANPAQGKINFIE